MQLFFKNRLIKITAVILFAAMGAATGATEDGKENRPHLSIFSISEKWLSVKKDFNAPTDGLVARIDDFCLALNGFFSSPIGSLYQIHRPETTEYLEQVNSTAERLRTAIINKDSTAFFLTAIEIDASLDGLQRVENDLSNASQRNSFSLFLFFSLLVIAVVISILINLYTSLGRAKKRERQSRAFSRQIITAQEQERSRVSRELHDAVLPLVHDNQVSSMIRSICVELMPPDFTRLSLNDTLAGLCIEFTKRSGIECACSIEDGLTFASYSPENQLHIYRMVQESFTNIEKHSRAGRAALVVRHSGENILICVSDDGQGLQSKPGLQSKSGLPEGAGLGIKSMCQRADILGAKLNFVSESGTGIMVRIEFPPTLLWGFQ
jgi:two-component system NarL family sensor kinase